MALSKTLLNNNKQGTAHDSQLKHLNRIEGQIRGIAKMIEDRRYCLDILNQLKAVKSSLSSIEKKLINEHLNHCVHQAVMSNSTKKANESMEEIKELLKSAKF